MSESMSTKSVCGVCSLRFKSKIDLSFREIRRLYSKQFNKAYIHRERIKRNWKEFMEGTLKIPGTF